MNTKKHSPFTAPLILSLETATSMCSVALHANGALLASSHLFIERSASSQLVTMIKHVLQQCHCKPTQLDAIAISAGPGSYTGLRIGAATAKGLCYALNIPLVAVNTLEALAQQVANTTSSNTLLCAMIDARRMEVFSMLVDRKGTTLSPVQATIIDEKSFFQWLETHNVLFFGSGAKKCMTTIQHPNACFLLDITPSAIHIGELALKKFNQQQVEDHFQFEPSYLKDFVAHGGSKVH